MVYEVWRSYSLCYSIFSICSESDGWCQLFFVLSGFLITSILLKEKRLSRYYLNGFIGDEPCVSSPYTNCTLCWQVCLSWRPGYRGIFPVLAFLERTHSIFIPWSNRYSYEDAFFMHFWSLSVEEQFYLIWPLVIFFCNRKTLGHSLADPCRRSAYPACFGRRYDGRDYLPHYVGETVYRFTLSQWTVCLCCHDPCLFPGKKELPAGKLLIATTTLFVILDSGIFNRWPTRPGHSSILPGVSDR